MLHTLHPTSSTGPARPTPGRRPWPVLRAPGALLAREHQDAASTGQDGLIRAIRCCLPVASAEDRARQRPWKGVLGHVRAVPMEVQPHPDHRGPPADRRSVHPHLGRADSDDGPRRGPAGRVNGRLTSVSTSPRSPRGRPGSSPCTGTTCPHPSPAWSR